MHGEVCDSAVTRVCTLNAAVEQFTVLGAMHDDCSFQYALNVNGTTQTWVLDNLRFAT